MRLSPVGEKQDAAGSKPDWRFLVTIVLPSGDVWQCLDTVRVVVTWERKGLGLARDDTEHLVIQPTVEDDLGSDASGAEFGEAASPVAG